MATKRSTSANRVNSNNKSNKRSNKNVSRAVEKKQSSKKGFKVVETNRMEEFQQKKDPKKAILKRIYITIIIILSIALLITTTMEIINIVSPSENALPTEKPKGPSPEELESERINNLFSTDIDLNAAREENGNDDIIARMEIPGVFNLLLTQTKDNDYYLDYNIKKKRSNKGNEFIDYRNTITDKQINVYGHNSRLYDLPFKQLELFLDKEFFDSNEYLLLQHDGGRRIYQIAAIKKVRTDNEHMLVKAKDQKEHISLLMNNTIHSRELVYDENTSIIVLQTCVRQDDGSYYLLIGFEVNLMAS